MRFQAELSTYSHDPQRKKKKQKERNDYDYSFNLFNPEGTIQKLLKGDILTSYEQINFHKYLELVVPSVIPAEAGIRVGFVFEIPVFTGMTN